MGARPLPGMLSPAVPPEPATAIWWTAVVDAIARRVPPAGADPGIAGGGREGCYPAPVLRRVRATSVR